MKLVDLTKYFLEDVEIFGSKDVEIKNLKAMHIASSDDMTYILSSKISRIEDLYNHPAKTIITDFFLADGSFVGSKTQKCIITTSNPRLQMAKFSHLFDQKNKSMIINKTTIFTSTKVLNNNIKIGRGTVLHAGVVLYDNIEIGEDCIIHAGTILGADGFGYEQDPKTKQWFKIAHLGKVKIGNNVEVGANTCIDRGTLGNTTIENGVKIDNLVHVAHNVHMKQNSVAIASSMIAGSCTIEEGAWIAPSSSIREGRKIGRNSLVGLGSVVIKDVEDNQIVMGVPAKPK